MTGDCAAERVQFLQFIWSSRYQIPMFTLDKAREMQNYISDFRRNYPESNLSACRASIMLSKQIIGESRRVWTFVRRSAVKKFIFVVFLNGGSELISWWSEKTAQSTCVLRHLKYNMIFSEPNWSCESANIISR